MGRPAPTSSSPSEPRSIADWHTPPKARKPQRRVRLPAASRPASSAEACTRSTNRPSPPGLTDDTERRAFGTRQGCRCDDPAAPTEVVVDRAGTQGRRRFRSVAVRADARARRSTPMPLQDSDRRHRAPTSQRGCRACRRRGDRHPASPRAPHPQRRAAPAASGAIAEDITAALLRPRLVVPGGARPARHGQDVHRGRGHRHGSSTSTVGAIGVVAQSHAVVENLFRDVIARRRRPGAGGQEDNTAPTRAGRRSTKRSYPGVHRRPCTGCVIGGTAWDFANAGRVPRGQPGPAGHRGGRAVQPGQHHRRGAGRAQPAAAGRPATAAAGQPGHPPRTGRHVRAGLADRRQAHAARRARVLPRPLLPHAPGRVRRGVAAVLRRSAALVDETSRAARRLDGVPARRARADRRPRRQLHRQPRRGRRDRRRDRAAARRDVDRRVRAPGRWRRTTCWSSRRTTRRW